MQFKKILVPIDFSKKALSEAVKLAGCCGGKIFLLHVEEDIFHMRQIHKVHPPLEGICDTIHKDFVVENKKRLEEFKSYIPNKLFAGALIKEFRQKMKAANLWLKGVRNLVELREWWQILRRKLIGHYNYYGISGNTPQIRKFYRRILSLVYKWINRRSQKKSYNWEQFGRFLKYNPLPRPKIYHLTYTLSSY
jgi:nucleotide-binding universal stress UspA family protein